MRLVLVLLSVLAVAGCSGGGDDDDDAVGDDDDDDGASPTPPPEMPAILSVAATDAVVSLPFGLNVNGNAGGFVGALSVTGNVGTIAVGGSSLAIAFYEKQPWPEFGYTLYQGLAVGASRWDVVWAYCDAGGLAYVWHEGMTGPALDYLAASGTCTDTDVATSTTVALPALSLETPTPIPGFTIDGDDLVLADDGGSGLVTLDGDAFPFVVFGEVDCTACGGDGWWELHSVAWDEAAARATFVILYLDFAYPDSVLAAYARSLPDFGDPFGVVEFDATWTSP